MRRTTTSGTLTTSLAEDVFSLLYMQEEVLDDFLNDNILLGTRKGDTMLVDGLLTIIRKLTQTQTSCLPMFLSTLEDCSAAANDFFRMSDKMETFIQDLLEKYPLLVKADEGSDTSLVRQEGMEMVSKFSRDAVQCAERSQVFIMRAIKKTSIPSDLFSLHWEDDWTRNQVVVQMLNVFEDYLSRYIHQYLCNEYLYDKALVVSAKAMICFYIRCLIEKADSVGRRRRNLERFRKTSEGQPFKSRSRALRRMGDDIGLMKDFFVSKAKDNVTLTRILIYEMNILELIHECLGATDSDSLETFTVVIHKRTGADELVTRYFMGDLWLLVANREGLEQMDQTMQVLQPDLEMVSKGLKERSLGKPRSDISFVRLDQMLKTMYEDRIAQGMIPVCGTCLPKMEDEGEHEVVAARIRAITRNFAEIRFRKQSPSSHGL